MHTTGGSPRPPHQSYQQQQNYPQYHQPAPPRPAHAYSGYSAHPSAAAPSPPPFVPLTNMSMGGGMEALAAGVSGVGGAMSGMMGAMETTDDRLRRIISEVVTQLSGAGAGRLSKGLTSSSMLPGLSSLQDGATARSGAAASPNPHYGGLSDGSSPALEALAPGMVNLGALRDIIGRQSNSWSSPWVVLAIVFGLVLLVGILSAVVVLIMRKRTSSPVPLPATRPLPDDVVAMIASRVIHAKRRINANRDTTLPAARQWVQQVAREVKRLEAKRKGKAARTNNRVSANDAATAIGEIAEDAAMGAMI